MNLKRVLAAATLSMGLLAGQTALAAMPFAARGDCYIGPGAGQGATVGDAIDSFGGKETGVKAWDKDRECDADDLLRTGLRIDIPGGPSFTTVVRGDVAGTGKMNLSQLSQFARLYKQGGEVPEEVLMAGDLNESGSLDLSDLALEAKGFKNGSIEGFIRSDDIPQAPDLAEMQKETLDETNRHRREANAAPLRLNNDLCRAAQIRAEEMAHTGEMSHTRPDGSSCFTVWECSSGKAENIIYSYARPQELALSSVECWRNSPPHYKNMTNPDYAQLGVGYAQSEDGTWYGCQLFMGEGTVTYVDAPAI